MPEQTARTFKVLLTASEAYPEFERCFLNARAEINCGFRVFDPWTRLHSDAAKAVGEVWVDLIADTLARGVAIRLVITDFDPVVRPDDHRATWRSVRGFLAAAEASGRPELLDISAAMHPARVGWLPRLPLWYKILGEISETTEKLNALSQAERDEYLSVIPLLAPLITGKGKNLRPRRWPLPPLVPATHHQKLAVFDNELLYIGGLDVNDRRYDDPDHQRSSEGTWHDVQLLMDGPAVQAAQDHLNSFIAVNHGKPAPRQAGLLRTISSKRDWNWPHLAPAERLNELAEAHWDDSARAEKLIYLESQFFRDTRFARHLAKQGRQKPDLQLILIMPAAPEEVAFDMGTKSDSQYGEYLQAKCVKILSQAYQDRIFIGSPAKQSTSGGSGRGVIYSAPLIYLHAKVSIFDDSSAIVGSANLNGRSLRWDTEAGIRTDTPAEVAQLTTRCFDHWLGADVNPACYDLNVAAQAWKDMARSNVRRPPEERSGFMLPYVSGPAKRFGRNLPGIPEEMV